MKEVIVITGIGGVRHCKANRNRLTAHSGR